MAPRYEQLLQSTGNVTGRAYASDRYEARRSLNGASVLVIDDTWASGGHAQSAAAALLRAGAGKLALVVIGRHLKPSWEPVQGSGVTCADLFGDLPVPFVWDDCVVHV